MVLLFWIIVIVWAIFSWAGPRFPAVAPYTWGPALVLFIILGYKLFGFPH